MSIDYENNKPVIEMKDIIKEFSGVRALSGITFDLYKGEIHCLVGENGAGKSTLMKVLSGAYKPDGGSIVVGEKNYKTLDPNLSQELGINIVYQENDLVPTMNVVENIFVGSEKTKKFGFIDSRAMFEETEAEMKDLGIDIDLNKTIENLSVAEQQFVKILKAISTHPKILIMDEPTSMFNVEDAGKVLTLAQTIAARGISIIYISHFLNEVVQIADRITVIRDGAVVSTYSNEKKDIPLDTITRDMVGRPVDMFYTKEEHEIGEVMFEVKGLRLAKDSPEINFNVRKGEILGFSGMVGSGRTEIIRAVSGADRRYSGDIYLNGKKLDIHNPADGIDAGIAHITEDRQKLGLMLGGSVLENTTIVGLRNKIKGFFINVKKEPPLIEDIIKDLNVKTPSVMQEVKYLSGGNQQKVVLGKWLFADQEVYIFDEPTRGIDVNAKVEFYKQMSNLTKQGKCIIMISSDMPELISMSDRVLVVRNGEITGELQKEQITEEEIIKRALGVNKS
nr:sugar ABC transporter ATP-binding protein [Christensenella intestinihominis]